MGKILKASYYLFFGILVILALLLSGMFLPKSIGYQIKIVQSGSMAPTIPTGSIVFVKSFENYVKDDVITFQRAGDQFPTTHRIVNDEVVAGSIEFIVKGDANDADDSKKVKFREVIGKVIFSLPYVGYLIDFIRQPIGFLLIIILPLLSVMYDEIRKIINAIKGKEIKQDEK